jgi:phosphoribosylanthranilate isomerase
MLIKVCGITRLEDAEAAVNGGARALGFVFWPGSPRFIDPHRARAIVARLPPFVTTVGVFVNQPVGHVNAVAALVRLGAVQLHGDEGFGYAAQMARPTLKAIGIGEHTESTIADAWPARITVLLDVNDARRRGGTGRTVDWAIAAAVAARRRAILAGGLTPDNVAQAVAQVHPFGIDVSSGVEQSPGIKDHGRIRALFEALHDHDTDHATRS